MYYTYRNKSLFFPHNYCVPPWEALLISSSAHFLCGNIVIGAVGRDMDAHFWFAIVVILERRSTALRKEFLVENHCVDEKSRQGRRKNKNQNAHPRAQKTPLGSQDYILVEFIDFVRWLGSVFGAGASALFAVPSDEASYGTDQGRKCTQKWEPHPIRSYTQRWQVESLDWVMDTGVHSKQREWKTYRDKNIPGGVRPVRPDPRTPLHWCKRRRWRPSYPSHKPRWFGLGSLGSKSLPSQKSDP